MIKFKYGDILNVIRTFGAAEQKYCDKDDLVLYESAVKTVSKNTIIVNVISLKQGRCRILFFDEDQICEYLQLFFEVDK